MQRHQLDHHALNVDVTSVRYACVDVTSVPFVPPTLFSHDLSRNEGKLQTDQENCE